MSSFRAPLRVLLTAALLATSLVALALPAPASAADGCIGQAGCPYTAVSVIGTSSPSSLRGPEGIAVSPVDGDIFVADTQGNRIVRYSSTGAFEAAFGQAGHGSGDLALPAGLDVDAAGNVYVADQNNARVKKFSPTGTFLAAFGTSGGAPGTLSIPRDVAVDAAGAVYVVDLSERVQKFSAAGAFVTAWGGDDGDGVPEDGEHSYVRSVAVIGSSVYVTDTTGVHRTALDGTGHELFGSYPDAEDVVSPDGGITFYVLDSPVVHVAGVTGAETSAFGEHGSTDGRLDGASRLAVSSTGDLLVANTGNDRVERLDSSGTFLAKYGSVVAGELNQPNGLAYDPASSTLWVADHDNHRVQGFGPGGTITMFGSGTADGQGSSDPGGFQQPKAVAVEGTSLFVVDTDPAQSRVQKFDVSSGALVDAFGASGQVTGSLQYPTGIDVHAGVLYVADAANDRVYTFDATTGAPGISIGAPGTGDGELDGPNGVAVDATGNVYVADTANGRIQKFSPDGTFIAAWGTEGSAAGQFSFPRAIAVGGTAGYVYVADTNNDRVQEFTPSGAFVRVIGTDSYEPALGSFGGPNGVAIDGTTLYVADTYNHRVQALTLGDDSGGGGVDTTAPVVRITYPADLSSSNVLRPTITGTAGNDVGDLTNIHLDFMRNVAGTWTDVVPGGLNATRTGTTWSIRVPANLVNGGHYFLRAYQSDASGNTSNFPVQWTVDATPPAPVKITSPAMYHQRDAGSWTIPLRGTAVHGQGQATSVRIRTYKAFVSNPSTQSTTASVHHVTGAFAKDITRTLSAGSWVVEVTPVDAAGNVGQSRSVDLIIREPLTKPANAGVMTITGEAEVGKQLGMSFTKPWTPAGRVTITYRWIRCFPNNQGCDTIHGARADSEVYSVVAADRGRQLRGEVTVTNAKGTVSRAAFSKLVPKVPLEKPRMTKPLTLGTNLDDGDLLTVSGEWVGNPTPRFTVQWQHCEWEIFCNDIPGATADRYRIQRRDVGHRLRVHVWACNSEGCDFRQSPMSPHVRANKAERRTANVNAAFQVALGRAPSAGELRDYTAHDVSDSIPGIVADLLRQLNSNDALARETVDRAYQQVYGHKHNSLQTNQYLQDVGEVKRKAKTYDDLVEQYATELARQARKKIFFWSTPLQNASVSRFVANARGDYYTNPQGQLAGMSAGEALWTDVALSNDAIHGAARVKYAYDGADGAADREGCFGGIGPGCKGSPVGDGEKVGEFVTLDGRKMAYIDLQTAIGSIIHDAVCRTWVQGSWCVQPVFGTDIWREHFFIKYLTPGSREWNKAVSNTLQARRWEDRYGPYPVADVTKLLAGKNGSSISYSDDLRQVSSQTRYTQVWEGGLFFGLFDLFPARAWDGKEIRATTRLDAPRGTALDSSDKDFCATGKFQTSGGGSDWKRCS